MPTSPRSRAGTLPTRIKKGRLLLGIGRRYFNWVAGYARAPRRLVVSSDQHLDSVTTGCSNREPVNLPNHPLARFVETEGLFQVRDFFS